MVAAMFAVACGGADTSGPGGTTIRGLRIVDGGGTTDTAAAVLAQALVVEVHDSTGALAPVGTTVRFTGVPRAQSTSTETLVAALSSTTFSNFATGTTDATGRTGVIVKLGTVAGPARLTIGVPIYGSLDTARYTVTPGAAAHVTIAPADTLVYVSAGYTFRGGVVDQFGNTRSDPITWTASGNGVTISSSGALSAASLGRYTITAKSGNGTGTAAVSVAPHGRLAGLVLGSPGGVGLADPDGSHVRVLASPTDGGVGIHPVWMPGGGSVIFTALIGGIETLQVADTNGAVRAFLPAPPSSMTHQADATPTSDGQWVYFGAYDSRCAIAYCLYRAHPDGSAAELLGTSATSRRESPSGAIAGRISRGLRDRVIRLGRHQNVRRHTPNRRGVAGQRRLSGMVAGWYAPRVRGAVRRPALGDQARRHQSADTQHAFIRLVADRLDGGQPVRDRAQQLGSDRIGRCNQRSRSPAVVVDQLLERQPEIASHD